MATYNGQAYIKEAITSILNQTFSDFELLVIDDGSTDQTVSIVKSFDDERIKLHRNEENIGLTKSLNKGLKLARGEYIARMDDDDVSLPQRLEMQVKFMDENQDVGACGSWLQIIDDTGEPTNVYETSSDHDEIVGMFLFHNAIFHPSVIIRKATLDEHKLSYDESFETTQDYDLWQRLSMVSRLANIPEALVKRRKHVKSISSNRRELQQNNADRVRFKLLKELGIDPTDEEAALHRQIANYEHATTLEYFQRAEGWLTRLWQSNHKRKLFPEEGFTTVIKKKWRAAFTSLEGNTDIRVQAANLSQLANAINTAASQEAPAISIVVCLYNRADLILDCLKALESQTAPQSSYEVIVVDNNSQDNGPELVSKFIAGRKNYKLVVEKQQGLSHARNRGWKEGKAKYIAYVDDDSKIAKSWVAEALYIIETHSPDIFGGPIYPFYANEKPEWFKDEYEIRLHYDKTGWMPAGKHLSGSNFVIKSALLDEYNGFNTSFGMVGGKIAYGEEVAIVERAHSEQRKLYYALELIVQHVVPDFKQNLGYFIFRTYRAGKDAAEIFGDSFSYSQMQEFPEKVDSVLLQFEEALKHRDSEKYRFAENYLIEEVIAQFHMLGRMSSFIRKNETINVSEALEYISTKNRPLSLKDFVKSILHLTKIFIRKR